MEEVTKTQRLEEGQILVRTIIEILGAPKEHIESTLKLYIEKLEKNENYEIIKKHIAETVTHDKMFSTFAELEIWFKDIEKLIEFCFDSLPSSIEILEPNEFRFGATKFSGLLNDLQAKLHKLDSVLKKHITDQKVGSQNFQVIINNFIKYILHSGAKSVDEVAEIVGLEKDKAEKWLDELVEKKIINKKGKSYSI